MATHIFTGKIPSENKTEPIQYGTARGWYHVVCHRSYRAPCAVSAARETLLAGGGDTLDPGSYIDILCDGVWVAPQLYGGTAVISIELRDAPTVAVIDPNNSKQSFATNKANVHELEPAVWANPIAEVMGLVEYEFRAAGGTIWIGSHVDRTQPPYGPNTKVGSGYPLHDGERIRLTGNPNMWVWTDQPGVRLYVLKIADDHDFVKRPV